MSQKTASRVPTTFVVGCTLVIGENKWGRAPGRGPYAIKQALKNAKLLSRSSYAVYECEDAGAFVSDTGNIARETRSGVDLVAMYSKGKLVPLDD